MSYEDLNDYELLDMVSEDEMATEVLYEKYRPLISKIATKVYYKKKIPGLELNDFIQEGMIGLSTAINSFDESKETTFFTFARLCIISRIFTLIITQERNKHSLLNESISVEAINSNQNLEKVFEDNDSNPENLMLSDENAKEMIEKIQNELTNFESEVFELKIAGFSQKEMEEILEKDKKAIYNALCRIKLKIDKYLKRKN